MRGIKLIIARFGIIITNTVIFTVVREFIFHKDARKKKQYFKFEHICGYFLTTRYFPKSRQGESHIGSGATENFRLQYTQIHYYFFLEKIKQAKFGQLQEFEIRPDTLYLSPTDSHFLKLVYFCSFPAFFCALNLHTVF